MLDKSTSNLKVDIGGAGSTMRICSSIRWGHVRLLFRWFRFSLRSVWSRDFDFVINAWKSQGLLLKRWMADLLFRHRRVECNLCGWRGGIFFPNVGPGYFELATTCPICLAQDRHRALITILSKKTGFFCPETKVVEVAPMRSFQQFCLKQKENKNYISFDLMRFAMEKGDITQMRYDDRSLDYFLCFHVLEHIPEIDKAMREIHRVLKLGGCAILQVPIDWSVDKTYEYDTPDPREVGHVRRYGKDFSEIISTYGFHVTSILVEDFVSPQSIERYGLSDEPIFFAIALENVL